MAKLDYEVIFEDHGNRTDSPALFIDTWMNNGWNDIAQERLEYKDLIATPNASHWLPRTIETIAREPIEPMLMVPALLDRIAVKAHTNISMPSIGTIVAADIAESEAYPERKLQVAPGTMTANVGKSGVAFAITEEMMAHSMFDVMNLHIRHGRLALDRHKEKKGFAYITGMGTTLYDNINPTTSIFGVCTGRSMSGSGNGSCRMEDLLNAYSHIMMQGFIPDTILMHPMAWSIWMADPLLKSIAKTTGNIGMWFQRHNMAKQALFSAQTKLGRTSSYGQYTPPGNAGSETPTSVSQLDQNLQSPAVIPDYFPYPLKVLVSPFAPYNVTNKTCDIMMFDSNNLGALMVETDVQLDEWEDPSTDTMKVKLKERYGIYIYEEGLGIGVLRNVPIVANEIAFPLQGTISAAGSLSEISATTAISGL